MQMLGGVTGAVGGLLPQPLDFQGIGFKKVLHDKCTCLEHHNNSLGSDFYDANSSNEEDLKSRYEVSRAPEAGRHQSGAPRLALGNGDWGPYLIKGLDTP